MDKNLDNKVLKQLVRIADSLEQRSNNLNIPKTNNYNTNCFTWDSKSLSLNKVENFVSIDLTLLKGLKNQSDILLENTLKFSKGFPANNVLLWGSRGTGKSSLVKSIFSKVLKEDGENLCLVEIHKEDLNTLTNLLLELKKIKKRIIIFCDDLSFEKYDNSFKSLKTLLDGSIESKPSHIIFYATSNRRHLIDRSSEENPNSFISEFENLDENVSLSDRFGIWIGFHNIDQKTYLEIVESYVNFYKLNEPKYDYKNEALKWSIERGSRSGRVAWQFIIFLAGKLEKKIEL